MKMQEIKELTDAELDHKLIEIRQDRLKLSIQAKTGQLTNPSGIRKSRREAARLKTELAARKSRQSAVNG
jgi:large subunit ribosomal protein L29